MAESRISPEILRMSELNDSSDLHTYSTAVLYVLSAVSPPIEYVEAILSNFVSAIKSTTVGVYAFLSDPGLMTSHSLLVLAYPTPSTADAGGVFLPEPSVHLTRRSVQCDGGPHGMSCR